MKIIRGGISQFLGSLKALWTLRHSGAHDLKEISVMEEGTGPKAAESSGAGSQRPLGLVMYVPHMLCFPFVSLLHSANTWGDY